MTAANRRNAAAPPVRSVLQRVNLSKLLARLLLFKDLPNRGNGAVHLK